MSFYDHDNVETNYDEKREIPVLELLKSLSCSSSFGSDAAAAAALKGITTAQSVFLLYGTKYRPDLSGITENASYRFIGAFEYDSDAPNLVT